MTTYKNVTINFVFDRPNDNVLMIKKLRGMRGFSKDIDGHAKDLYNFPGGKNEEGESFADCAARETFQETGIIVDARDLKQVGMLRFLWPNDYVILCPVFAADKFSGELKTENCDECVPHWIKINKIPYENMWPDDKSWVPKVLNGEPFHLEIGSDDSGARIFRSLPLNAAFRQK